MSSPFLSIIVPAYNEESRLPATLEQVNAFLQAQSYTAEVLIVENGSQDRTLQVAQDFSASHPQFRALHEDGRGKGRAVRRGMLEAQGEFRFMCDADLSMPIAEINRFLPPALDGYDLAIASREAPGAVRYNEPFYRHWGGRGINLMIRLLALPGLQDTQCGFKCLHTAVVEDLFSCQTLEGWSFDVELLYVARLRGYKIVEIPIPWYFSSESKLSDSKFNLVKNALRMLADILLVRWNALQGVYDRQVQAK